MTKECNDKKCFVIMPISMPPHLKPLYREDEKHFIHVFEHLLKPSLKNAGYEAIPPGIKGSEIIHTEIIRNLEKSELVLCDISILNPNVFFELGLRTALNKPICMIRDNQTERIPFDTHLINCHTYNSKFEVWSVDNEISNMTEHIKATKIEDNALWKIFGFTEKGISNEISNPSDGIKHKDLLIEKLQLEIEKLESSKNQSVTPREFYLHKCSKCGYGMEVTDLPTTYAAVSWLSPVNASAALISPELHNRVPKSNGVKCPKCGNIDAI